MFFSIDATPESGRYGRLVNHSKVQTLCFVLLVVFTMHSGATGLLFTFFLFIVFLCLPRDFLDCFYRFLTILSMIPITFIILKVLIHVCREGEVSLLGFISLLPSLRILDWIPVRYAAELVFESRLWSCQLDWECSAVLTNNKMRNITK